VGREVLHITTNARTPRASASSPQARRANRGMRAAWKDNGLQYRVDVVRNASAESAGARGLPSQGMRSKERTSTLSSLFTSSSARTWRARSRYRARTSTGCGRSHDEERSAYIAYTSFRPNRRCSSRRRSKTGKVDDVGRGGGASCPVDSSRHGHESGVLPVEGGGGGGGGGGEKPAPKSLDVSSTHRMRRRTATGATES